MLDVPLGTKMELDGTSYILVFLKSVQCNNCWLVHWAAARLVPVENWFGCFYTSVTGLLLVTGLLFVTDLLLYMQFNLLLALQDQFQSEFWATKCEGLRSGNGVGFVDMLLSCASRLIR